MLKALAHPLQSGGILTLSLSLRNLNHGCGLLARQIHKKLETEPIPVVNKAPNTYNPFDEPEIVHLYPHVMPAIPGQVFERIRKFCEENGGQFDLAVDAGCATGQATVPFSKQYSKVIGVDGSAGFIAAAPKNVDNVTFRVADCNKPLTFLQPETVDLVNISSALHWLDRDKFFSEVDRLLKPGGHLSVTSTFDCTFIDPELNELSQSLLLDTPLVYPEREVLFQDRLTTLVMPYANTKRFPEYGIIMDLTIDEFLLHFQAIHKYCLHEREHPGFLVEVKKKMHEALKLTDPDKTFKAYKPYFSVISQKPKK